MSDIEAKLDFRGVATSLDLMDNRMRGKSMAIAASAAAGIIKKAMVARAPVLSGGTKKSINVRRVKVKKAQKRIVGPSYKRFKLRRKKTKRVTVGGVGRTIAIPESKKNRETKELVHIPGNVAHLTEYGHEGPHPAPASPWMGPAFDQSKGIAMDKMNTKLWEEIRKAAAVTNSKTQSPPAGL